MNIRDEKQLHDAYNANRAEIDKSIKTKIAKYKAKAVRARLGGQHGVAATFIDLANSLEMLVGV